MNDYAKQITSWPRGLAGLLGLLLLLTSGPRAIAQTFPTNPDGTPVNPAVPMVRPDTARRTEKLFGFRLTKPAKAGFLAIIPGGGQIYNKKYWKLPLVYGLVGGLGYWIVYQQRYFGYYKFASAAPDSATIRKATSQIPDDDLRNAIATVKVTNPNNIANALITTRRYRDLSILLSAVGYSLTVLDAVVDAHLSEFDVSDDLSLRWHPTAVPVPGQAAFAPGVVLVLRTRR
jgi:hypothetical protein